MVERRVYLSTRFLPDGTIAEFVVAQEAERVRWLVNPRNARSAKPDSRHTFSRKERVPRNAGSCVAESLGCVTRTDDGRSWQRIRHIASVPSAVWRSSRELSIARHVQPNARLCTEGRIDANFNDNPLRRKRSNVPSAESSTFRSRYIA